MGVDEAANEVVSRTAQQVIEAALLHNPAVAQQDDAVTEIAGLAHVVRHQHHGFTESLEDAFQVLLQVVADERIEGAHWLVQEEDNGVQHQGPHDTHALPLATRQLRGIAIEGLSGKARQLGQPGDAPFDIAFGPVEIACHKGYVGARSSAGTGRRPE